jgi:hypothetical protein
VREADSTGKTVYRKSYATDQLGQCTAYYAQKSFELKGSVLAMAKSEAVSAI